MNLDCVEDGKHKGMEVQLTGLNKRFYLFQINPNSPIS